MTDDLEQEIIEKYPKLYDAILGNAENIKTNLIAASLFIMSYECLKSFVSGQFESFFIHGFERNEKDEMINLYSENWLAKKDQQKRYYQSLVKKITNEKIDLKKITLFQAGCAWLHEMQGFTDRDILKIIEATRMRNNLAHELYTHLFDEKLPTIDKKLVESPLNLYFQISNWWIRNVEYSIAPEDYAEFSEDDMLSAATMNAHFLQIMINKTLGENS